MGPAGDDASGLWLDDDDDDWDAWVGDCVPAGLPACVPVCAPPPGDEDVTVDDEACPGPCDETVCDVPPGLELPEEKALCMLEPLGPPEDDEDEDDEAPDVARASRTCSVPFSLGPAARPAASARPPTTRSRTTALMSAVGLG